MHGNPIIDADDWNAEEDAALLFHGTSSRHLQAILRDGLTSGSCFGTEAVARYFAGQECEASGGRRIILALPLSRFRREDLQADAQMAEFPIFSDYDVRDNLWEDIPDGEATWQDGFRIYESIACAAGVAILREDVLGKGWQPPDAVLRAPKP